MSASDLPYDPTTSVVLKASYSPVKGSNVEHGQGAIERLELPHRPLTDTTWLLRLPKPADRAHWEKRLNQSVDPAHGCFELLSPTAEEQGRVDRGELTFQQ